MWPSPRPDQLCSVGRMFHFHKKCACLIHFPTWSIWSCISPSHTVSGIDPDVTEGDMNTMNWIETYPQPLLYSLIWLSRQIKCTAHMMWCLSWHGALTGFPPESQQCCLLTAALIDGPIYPPPTQTSLFIFNLMIKSRRQGWQSAHSSVSTLRMLPMSKLLSPPPRLLPLLEDLPVHAVGLHFRHIVSLLLSRVC